MGSCGIGLVRLVGSGHPRGEDLRRRDRGGLDEAKCVIVLWSEHSVKSRWVMAEAGEATSKAKMVPAQLDDVRVPLAFRRIQSADLTGWTGDPSNPGLRHLLTAVQSLVPASEQQSASETMLAHHDAEIPLAPKNVKVTHERGALRHQAFWGRTACIDFVLNERHRVERIIRDHIWRANLQIVVDGETIQDRDWRFLNPEVFEHHFTLDTVPCRARYVWGFGLYWGGIWVGGSRLI